MSSKSTPYTLTTADVDAYLDTQQDDDPIGCTFHSGDCLLARAFKWKYRLGYVTISPDRIYIPDTGIGFPLDGATQTYLCIFDGINKPPLHDVTKREWLEAKARDEMEREVFAHGQ